MYIDRRNLLKLMSLTPLLMAGATPIQAEAAVSRQLLKEGYRHRLTKLLAAKAVPYIDIESSCDSTTLDIDRLAKEMDSFDIGLMAMSADITGKQFEKGVRNDPLSARLIEKYSDRFIPTGNGGVPPVWTKDQDVFLTQYEEQVKQGAYLLMGEFEFRHYPSPRQVERGALHRDIAVPIDGVAGHRLFRLSEASGLAFQIHYEIEDELLPPFEKMLATYPRVKVIWCHLAQIRYLERTQKYSANYVEGLIKKFPNLYFDTAFGDASSLYKPSGQRHARVWTADGEIKKEWLDLLVAYPQRFLAALDLGGDRMDRVRDWNFTLRGFLRKLPSETQHQVAYRSAWKILFNEDFA